MRAPGVLVTLTVVSLLARGAGGEAVETLKNVAYVDDPHPEQELDFSWPEGRPEDTVLFIHGGSLKESAERRTSPIYRDVCRPFLASGVACATMGSHYSSIEDVAKPGDPGFERILAFIRDPTTAGADSR